LKEGGIHLELKINHPHTLHINQQLINLLKPFIKMKTLNWRHTDWSAKNFIFSIGQEIVGKLTFNSSWNFNAVYSDEDTNLKFTQKGFWNRDVQITKDGEAVGEIKFRLFGNQTLKLTTGEQFTLSSNAWGRNVTWKTQEGKTIIEYKQATMSSMGKGVVSFADSLTNETEKLLISSGLFVRQLIRKRVAITMAIAIPIIAAANS